MVIKSALEDAGIPLDQMLQILAGITRTAPLVSLLLQFAKKAIRQTVNFKVLDQQQHPPG
jgi:hypothetical protein